jgi:monoamine oxidase
VAPEKPPPPPLAAAEEEEAGAGGDEGAYDAIVVGSGIGGLVAATQLAAKGARVLVLEKYLIPGGSSGYYRRDGFTFDVGSSVMFGFSDKVGGWVCANADACGFGVGTETCLASTGPVGCDLPRGVRGLDWEGL